MPAPAEKSPWRLLVEGTDDLHTVVHLMKRHGYDWDDATVVRPFVSPVGSIEKLLSGLGVAAKGPYSRLGVVLDANGDPGRRWAQLVRTARKAGVRLPDGPDPAGVVAPGRLDGTSVGAWMMPDCLGPGTLEDFVASLVPAHDAVWAWSAEAAAEARRRGASWRDVDARKAQLHGWLAWQEEPGLPYGTALRAGFLAGESTMASGFAAWFRRLFA